MFAVGSFRGDRSPEPLDVDDFSELGDSLGDESGSASRDSDDSAVADSSGEAVADSAASDELSLLVALGVAV